MLISCTLRHRYAIHTSYPSNGSSLRPFRKMFIGCGLSGKNTSPGYAQIQTTAIFPSHIAARSVANFVFRLPVCDADGKKRRIDRSFAAERRGPGRGRAPVPKRAMFPFIPGGIR